jgi:predicted nucleotidyltransferase
MVEVINSHRTEIEKLCRDHGVRLLYLFGSAVGARFKPQSDIDMAVAFNRDGIAGSFDQFFDFKASLEELLSRPVDLVCIDRIRNRVFRKELEAGRELLYAA